MALGRWLNHGFFVQSIAIEPQWRSDEPTIRAAIAGFDEALALAAGDGWCARLCLNNLVECMTDIRDFHAAQRFHDQLATVAGKVDQRSHAHQRFALGHLDAARGRSADRLRALTQSLAIARATKDAEMASPD